MLLEYGCPSPVAYGIPGGDMNPADEAGLDCLILFTIYQG